MYVAKEATQISKIEGTQTNIEDAFLDKEDLVVERRDDWVEVHYYIDAMNQAMVEVFSGRHHRNCKEWNCNI